MEITSTNFERQSVRPSADDADTLIVRAHEPALRVARLAESRGASLICVMNNRHDLLGYVQPSVVIEVVRHETGHEPNNFTEAVRVLGVRGSGIEILSETRVKLYRCRRGGETKGGNWCSEHNSPADPY